MDLLLKGTLYGKVNKSIRNIYTRESTQKVIKFQFTLSYSIFFSRRNSRELLILIQFLRAKINKLFNYFNNKCTHSNQLLAVEGIQSSLQPVVNPIVLS